MGSPSLHHYTPLANTGTLDFQAQKGPEVIFGPVPTEYQTAGALIFIQAGSSCLLIAYLMLIYVYWGFSFRQSLPQASSATLPLKISFDTVLPCTQPSTTYPEMILS